MIRKSWIALTLIVLLAGCRASRPDDRPSPDSTREIALQPNLLADFATPIEQLSLQGVRLGDAPDAIDRNRIISQDKNGWIVCGDLSRYRIVAGKVVTLGVWNQKILAQLGIETEADIERVFGKAESIEKVETLMTQMTIHRVDTGRRRVNWDRIQGRLGSINIGSPEVGPTETAP